MKSHRYPLLFALALLLPGTGEARSHRDCPPGSQRGYLDLLNRMSRSVLAFTSEVRGDALEYRVCAEFTYARQTDRMSAANTTTIEITLPANSGNLSRVLELENRLRTRQVTGVCIRSLRPGEEFPEPFLLDFGLALEADPETIDF